MGPYVLVHSMLAGFFAFAALHYFWYWWLSRRERVFLVFALYCGVCSVVCIPLLVIATAPSADVCQRALDARGTLVLLAQPLIAAVYALVTGVRARAFLTAVAVVFTLAAVANSLVAPVFGTVTGLERVRLSWGEEVTFPRRGPAGWWIGPLHALAAAVQVFGLAAAARLWRRNRSGAALVTLAAASTLLFQIPSVLADVFRIQIPIPFVGAIPNAVVVVFISLTLSRAYARRGEQVIASEGRFRNLVEQASDGIVISDARGHCLDANPAACQMLGYEPGQFQTLTLADLIVPEEAQRLAPEIARLTGGSPVRSEWQFRRKDGSWFWGEVNGRQLPDGRLLGFVRDISERKRSLERLATSEARYRALIESAPEAIVVLDAGSGLFVDSNRNACELFGVSADEIRTLGPADLSPPEQPDGQNSGAAAARFVRAAVAGEMPVFEWLHRSRGGRDIPCEVRLARLPDPHRVLLRGSVTDITARKRAEEAMRAGEERFRTAFDDAAIGMALVGPNGRWLRVNRALCELVGYTEAELLATDFQTITHPEDLGADLGYVRLVLEGTIRTYQMEKRYLHKRGHVVHILLSVSLVRDARGEPLHFIAQIQDITQRHRAEEALARSEERYRLIVRHQTEFIVKWLPDGTRTFVNESYCKYFGVREEDCIGTSFFPLISPEYRELVRRKIASITPENPEASGEHLSIAAGGERRWQQWTDVGVFDAEGRLVEYLSTGRDITERKEAEEKLRASEHRQRLALDAARMGTWDWDLVENRLIWDARQQELFGFTPGEFDGRLETFLGRVHPEDVATVRERVAQGVELGEYRAEFRVYRKPGDLRWLSGRGQLIRGEDGRALRVIGINQDVTDRVLAEERLRERETFLRLAQEAAHIGSWEWDMGANHFRWSDELARMHGISAAEFDGSPETVLGFCHPGDRGRLREAMESMLTGGHVDGFECRVCRRDGAERAFWFLGQVQRDEWGVPVRVLGVAIDITARKHAEETLREAQEFNLQVLASTRHGVVVLDRDLRYRMWNSAMEEMTGVPADQVLGRSPQELFPFLEAEGITAAMRRALAGEVVHTHDYRYEVRQTGRSGWSAQILGPVRNSRGEVVGVLGSVIEMTARREAQEENRRLLRALGERVKELTCLHRAAGILTDKTLGTTEWIQRITLLLPPAYQYPEDAAARIRFGDLEVVTPGFARTPWGQRAEFVAADGVAGLIEVVYLREMPAEAEGPFLIEERNLLTSLAEMMCSAINRRTAEESLRTRNNLYAMLAYTNRAVSRCTSSESLFREVCEIAVDVGKFQFAWVGVPAGDRVKCVVSAGTDGGYMDNLVVSLDDDDPRSHGPTGRAFRTGRSYVVNDFMSATMTAPWHHAARRVGFAASAALPLVERGRVVAVLTLYASTPGFFTDDLVATLGEIAPSVSFALDAFVRDQARVRAEMTLVANERRMREEKQFLDTLMDTLPGVVFLFDAGGRFLKWNKVLEQATGYTADEVVRLSPLDFIARQDAEAVARAIRNVFADGHDAIESSLVTKDGRAIPHYFKGVRLVTEDGPYLLGIGLDISDRRRLEEQFRQAQKMEAVGRLAGGVAHDFNNLLTVINGFSDMMLADAPDDDPRREPLTMIRDAGDRAAQLTKQLLAFSRRAVLEPKVLDLNRAVEHTSKLLRRLVGEDVTLVVRPDPRLALLKIDPGQLEQVVMNLAVNARDAMPTGGTITIETADVLVPDEEPAPGANLPPGRYIKLSVADTGHGMTDEVKTRLFEPFFTTKGLGKGTGLGLAVVHGVVQQSGGHIRVESGVGAGTTFTILFPAANPDSAERQAEVPRPTGRATGTVLLVEDESAVRAVAKIALEVQGFNVLEADCGAGAIRIARDYAGAIDLMITDVVMPGVGGRQLATTVQGFRPGLRVLYMSGYTDDAVVHHGVASATDAFLQKPFTPLGLVQKTRMMLDGR